MALGSPGLFRGLRVYGSLRHLCLTLGRVLLLRRLNAVGALPGALCEAAAFCPFLGETQCAAVESDFHQCVLRLAGSGVLPVHLGIGFRHAHGCPVKSARPREPHDSSLTSASLTTLRPDSSSPPTLADTARIPQAYPTPSLAAQLPSKSDKPGHSLWRSAGHLEGAASPQAKRSANSLGMGARGHDKPVMGLGQGGLALAGRGVVHGAGEEVQPLVAARAQDYARGRIPSPVAPAPAPRNCPREIGKGLRNTGLLVRINVRKQALLARSAARPAKPRVV